MIVRNKAAENLRDLNQDAAQGANVARQVQQAHRTAMGSDDVRPNALPDELPEDRQADFDTGAALATGVAASFLLGPVGGLLLAGAQGILGQKSQQNALDQFYANSDAMQDIFDTYEGTFDALRSQATTPAEMAQVDTLQQNMRVAAEMAKVPSLQEDARELLATTQADLVSFQAEQEKQQIEYDAAEAERKREMTAEDNAYYDQQMANYTAESEPFLETVRLANEAGELLDGGNAVAQDAGLVRVQQVYDRLGQVRDEDLARLGGNQGVLDSFAGWRAKLDTGEPLDARELYDLHNVLNVLTESMFKQQRAREIRYNRSHQERGMPLKYQDNFAWSNEQEVYRSPLLDGPRPPGAAADLVDDAGEVADDTGTVLGGMGESIARDIEEGFSREIEGARRIGEAVEERIGIARDYFRGGRDKND